MVLLQALTIQGVGFMDLGASGSGISDLGFKGLGRGDFRIQGFGIYDAGFRDSCLRDIASTCRV